MGRCQTAPPGFGHKTKHIYAGALGDHLKGGYLFCTLPAQPSASWAAPVPSNSGKGDIQHMFGMKAGIM